MFVIDRQEKIKEIIEEKGKVRVKDLAKEFNCSEDLIRKDLTRLEILGICKKVYGGAIKLKTNVHQDKVSDRILLNIKEKQSIAKKALKLINKKDFIFLDISTTNIELAKMLINENLELKIATNSIDILNILIHSHSEVIFIGGKLNTSKDGFEGALTNNILKNFMFDIAFMGAVGIDIEKQNVQTYSLEDGLTKTEVLKDSKRKYIITEKEKFDHIGNLNYAKINEFDGIISYNLDSNLKKALKNLNIEIID